jgi:hypothetical protein
MLSEKFLEEILLVCRCSLTESFIAGNKLAFSKIRVNQSFDLNDDMFM